MRYAGIRRHSVAPLDVALPLPRTDAAGWVMVPTKQAAIQRHGGALELWLGDITRFGADVDDVPGAERRDARADREHRDPDPADPPAFGHDPPTGLPPAAFE